MQIQVFIIFALSLFSTMQEYQQHHLRPQQERLIHPRLLRLGHPHLRVPHHHLNRVGEEEEVSPVSGWPLHLINTNEVLHLYRSRHGIRLSSDVSLTYLTIVPINLFAQFIPVHFSNLKIIACNPVKYWNGRIMYCFIFEWSPMPEFSTCFETVLTLVGFTNFEIINIFVPTTMF